MNKLTNMRLRHVKVLKTNCTAEMKTKSEPYTTVCYRAQIKYSSNKDRKKIYIVPKCQDIFTFENSYECMLFSLYPSHTGKINLKIKIPQNTFLVNTFIAFPYAF